ncbi:MAG: PAS domain S-box protein [Tepidamorphaceae bacterium]|nr:PAS domain S-box protein [Rhodobiaceae bacterium]MCC0050214.1 PAS domain S-box protein [Rhodobiaceae bacterium]
MDFANLSAETTSQARLLSVLDTAVDGIIVINDGGRILVFNKACEKLFGYPAGEVLGENVNILMPQNYSDHHDEYLNSYLTTGQRKIIGIGRAVHGRHKDGSVFPLELSVGESATPDGRQFIGILRDLRPKVEAEERLDAVQAQLVRMARVNAMDEMGSALAHELNQPLTALMLYLQAVTRRARKSDDVVIPPEMLEVIDRAVEEADRAGKIIRRVRQFIEKRDIERVRVSLAELVDEATDFTMIGSRTRGVTVNRNHSEGVADVYADPIQIQQIIVNLLRNALDALVDTQDQTIDIETWQDGDRVAMEIADSGPGIAPSMLPDLFKAFATSKATGTGLGLAISRTIAQSHGGDLTVQPGGNGQGARFRLVLPVFDTSGGKEQTNGH